MVVNGDDNNSNNNDNSNNDRQTSFSSVVTPRDQLYQPHVHSPLRVGVLFLNLGGPERTEDVEGK